MPAALVGGELCSPRLPGGGLGAVGWHTVPDGPGGVPGPESPPWDLATASRHLKLRLSGGAGAPGFQGSAAGTV